MAPEFSWTNRESESARQLHHHLREARHGLGLAFDSDLKWKRAREFEELWDQTLPKVKAISIDIFDTALIRTFLAPDDTFLFLKEMAPFASTALSLEEIHQFRIQAERQARAILHRQTSSVEVTLAEIYACFAEKARIDPAQIPDLVKAEQSLELLACRPHLRIRRAIQQAVARGKQILFVSDTYHSRTFLHELLIASGYSITGDRIFASCEYREGKYSGLLLIKAIKALGLKPGEVAHLGDNAESDEKGARTAGMASLLHPFAVRNECRHQALGARKIETLLLGTAQAASSLPHANEFWFRLGCETFGPALASFVLWLIAQWRRDQIAQVFFCLRDGLILSQIYDVLRGSRPDLPPAALLHTSRRAFTIPALTCEQNLSIDALLVSGNPRPAREFLSRLDLDPAQFLDAFKKAGFASPDEIVDHRGDPTRVILLFRQPEISAALGRRSLAERKLLVRYLEQEKVTTTQPTAIVDIGWNNTVQKSLLAVLDHEKIAHNLHGYYLGTFGDAQDFELRDYRYRSYLCHDGEPIARSGPLASCRVLLEIVCTSFEGSLRSFTKKEGRIAPVLDPSDMTSAQGEILHAIHEGVLAHARTLAGSQLARGLEEIPAEIASGNLLRLIESPSPEEAEKIGALEHGDGAGSHTRKPLAAFGHDSLAPKDLLDSYHNAYWKKALLSLDTAQSMALRQLISPLS